MSCKLKEMDIGNKKAILFELVSTKPTRSAVEAQLTGSCKQKVGRWWKSFRDIQPVKESKLRQRKYADALEKEQGKLHVFVQNSKAGRFKVEYLQALARGGGAMETDSM